MVKEPGGGTAISQGLVQGLFNQRCFQRGTGSPTDDFSAIEVHDRSQIEPALGSEDVSDIADPDLVCCLGLGRGRQAVGCDGIRMVGVGGFGTESAFLAGFEMERAHVTCDAVAAARDAGLAQADGHARTAVEFAVLVKEADQFLCEALVVDLALAGWACEPGVIGAARYPQSLADIFDGVMP